MPDRPESLDEVLEPSVAALARSGDDALSKACSEGCPDWGAVVAWTDRTRQLVLRQRQPSVLRAELPSMAGRLLEILRATPASPDVDPEWLVARFVERLPEVRACLAEDVEAAHEGDPASKSFAEIVVAYPSIQAVTVHRLAHQLFLLGVPVLARVMSEYAHGRTGIDIHPGATIGRRFFIDHGTGVVIGETAVVEDDVSLLHGVTLGGTGKHGGDRHPKVGPNVLISAGAAIFGNIRIGEGAKIGGGSVVLEDVPPHRTAVGVPARVVGRPASDRPALEMDQTLPGTGGDGI